MQPATMGFWLIKGDVYVPETNLDVTFQADNIWIKSGSLNAGTSSIPHPGKIKIIITGNKNDGGIVIDPLTAGNKMFVVTGKL
jgi:hypothetical protein